MKLRNDFADDPQGWWSAVRLVCDYLDAPGKADDFLRRAQSQHSTLEAKVCQSLFLGVLRHASLLDSLINDSVSKKPRRLLDGVLRVAGFQLIDAIHIGRPVAPVIHYAVDRVKRKMSRPESSLVNAVLRRWQEPIEATRERAQAGEVDAMARFYSHPRWLVKRWVDRWGEAGVLRLLDFNQRPAPVFVRVFREPDRGLSEGFEATDIVGVYRHISSDWSEVLKLLERGWAIIQDPATRLAIEILDPQPGETVLDLCSAPGGKAITVAAAVGPEGRVYTIDLPRERLGPRFHQWEVNAGRALHRNVAVFEADLLEVSDQALKKAQYPLAVDKVMLDVPCSNTGVLNRRPDARYRLKKGDPDAMVKIQSQLLSRAAQFVAAGGRLVYSTCSLEPEENEGVVGAFLESDLGSAFRLEIAKESWPHRDGFDGAAVFGLRRSKV
ncbi:MAG: RsmB/NOP family class I SAM-dependent RNA methyltransferase [Opitutales bacterium]|nr:RsmB/NOP family class I SAM-dependent RNA methyltransferase [Opitutales bacterium]NRA26012.1 RsmB/NOP family class I SAM-dependent RNA methyltransferase [Opitutales bacterium]